MTPDEFNKRIKSLQNILSEKNFKESLGMYIRQLIYARTKLGKGVSSGDADSETVSNVKLKPLSESYKKVRAGKLRFFTSRSGHVFAIENSKNFKIQKPSLGKLGTPNKSNLTFSGQMLEALKFEQTTRGVKLFIESSSRSGSKLDNDQVASYVSKDRPFLNMSKNESKRVEQFISDEIDRRMQKAFS